MAVAFVDANVLIAAASARDVDHGPALEVLRGIDAGTLPVGRVSNYVVAEVLNYLHARHRHGLAVEFYERLSGGAEFEIVHATKRDYHKALDVFSEHASLSFVDATIVSYMRREGLSFIYSFDDDFDGIDGFTRLNAAENPFD